MSRPRALFFDLDGTLLDGSGAAAALRRVCADIAAARPGLSAGRLLEANGEIWRVYWPEVEDTWTLGGLSGAALGLEAWRRTLQASGCDDEALAGLAMDAHIQHAREESRLFPDAEQLLSLLPASLPLALITNGASDTQRDKLNALGLVDRFAAVIISGEAGAAKPAAVVFRTALDILGCDPQSVWHVGDNLATDVAGANAAGITSVWLNRTGVDRADMDPKPGYEVGSLLDLMALLAVDR